MSTSDPRLLIEENQLSFIFMRADGPGGQNVNKVSSAVQLRFDLENSTLPDDIKARLMKLAGKRVTQEGVLIIEARLYRKQESNRADAIRRFYKLDQKAIEKPRLRKKTKPTRASQEKRLQSKKERSAVKKLRGKASLTED